MPSLSERITRSEYRAHRATAGPYHHLIATAPSQALPPRVNHSRRWLNRKRFCREQRDAIIQKIHDTQERASFAGSYFERLENQRKLNSGWLPAQQQLVLYWDQQWQHAAEQYQEARETRIIY